MSNAPTLHPLTTTNPLLMVDAAAVRSEVGALVAVAPVLGFVLVLSAVYCTLQYT